MPALLDRDAMVANQLYERLIARHDTFWSLVYPLFMAREITRATVCNIVRRGLEDARGNFQQVVRNFNMPPHDHKRFLNFLKKYDCQLPFEA